MTHGFDQKLAAMRILQQILFKIRVADHHPDITEHFVEHPGASSGADLRSQFTELFPGIRAQKLSHDFLVREGRVVIGDFSLTL